MKAAFLKELKKIEIKDIPKPFYNDDEVLIKIKEVGLCGSDVHFYNNGGVGDFIIKKPIILGHESSGLVAEVGKNVRKFKIGDRVAIEPGVPCCKCEFCKSGNYNLCPEIKFLATPPFDGAFVEYISYNPNFIFKLPDCVSYTEAALIEPLSVGYSCIIEEGMKAGDNICILGCGPIGLACLEFSRIFGASRIFVSDISDYRLNIAKNHGADETINVQDKDIIKEINNFTDGYGVDCVIEASGFEESLSNSIRIVKKGGRLIWVGLRKEQITIPYFDIIAKGIMIKGNFRYKNTYETIIRILESKMINFKSWVSHRFELNKIQEAFDLENNQNIDNFKIMINI